MSDEHLIERTIERHVVHRGRFITFRVDTIEDADGNRHTREIAEHPGAVCIVPVVGQDLLMVRQFRTPIGRVLLELPAGTLDPGPDGSVEDPGAASARELEEETGYAAASWRMLGRFWTAPGFTSELMHLYLAWDLEPLADHSGPDEDERLELVRIPRTEAIGMAAAGEIMDAKSLVGLLQLARLIGSGEFA